MEKVFLGKIVNTHGIKGEIRILSDFEYKKEVFKIGNYLIISNNTYEIKSYRVHKDYDMITFKEFNNINEVLFMKGKNVYFDRNILKDKILLIDYIGLSISCNDEFLGTVIDYDNGVNPLLKINYNDKIYYIPLKGDYIDKVKDKIYVTDKTKELII